MCGLCTNLGEHPQERHRRSRDHHHMGCHYGCVSHYEHQSVESAGDCVDESLKLLRLLRARLRSGAAHLEPRHREQRQCRREFPKYPIEIDHAITP